jgi:hypothetical protein
MEETKGFYEFLAVAKTNGAIQQELDALDGKPYAEYCTAFKDLGARHGYTFGVDEVEDALEEMLAARALKSGELTDEQLEAVAGGSSPKASSGQMGPTEFVVVEGGRALLGWVDSWE